jgi:hypothetical protein
MPFVRKKPAPLLRQDFTNNVPIRQQLRRVRLGAAYGRSQNSKSEILNPKQIQITKTQNSKQSATS